MKKFFFCILIALSTPAALAGETWKGSLDNLSQFMDIIDLSDKKTRQRALITALSNPGISLESVSIHAYTFVEACQDAFLWRKMANEYGALTLSFDGNDNIQTKWFDELDNACNSNEYAKQGDSKQCASSDSNDRGCEIARRLKNFVENKEFVENTNRFIYTTAPLPYAKKVTELRGLCDINTRSSDDGDSACNHKLSRR